MLSVCTTTYKETIALEIFIRSLFGNASNPKDIELIICNDEECLETEQVLNSLSLEFPKIKHFAISKYERINEFQEKIDFYKEENIFEKKIIDDMYEQIEKYKTGQIDNLWYPPGRIYNKVANKAKGSMLMILPSDYLCLFDATKIYKLARKSKSFVGYFDWIDLVSVEQDFDIVNEFKSFKHHNDFRRFSRELYDNAKKQKVTIIPGQHGARILDRKTFNKSGGFDDRWFLRAVAEDEFNQKVGRSYETILANNPRFGKMLPYVCRVKYQNILQQIYLTSFYNISADVHAAFSEMIRHHV
jgi:hypothetical protein